MGDLTLFPAGRLIKNRELLKFLFQAAARSDCRWNSERREAAKRYDAMIETNHLQTLLVRPTEVKGRLHTYNQYVVRVQHGRRDGLMVHLKDRQIGCEIYYPLSLHQHIHGPDGFAIIIQAHVKGFDLFRVMR